MIPFVGNVRGPRAGVNVDEGPQTRLIISQTEALPAETSVWNQVLNSDV